METEVDGNQTDATLPQDRVLLANCFKQLQATFTVLSNAMLQAPP
jgi:hypothetical protein